MNKSLALTPVAFAIFALMISPGIMSVSADPESSNGNGSANVHPNDCSNSQGKAAQKNPNCEDGGSSSQFTACDFDGDGIISKQDLLDYAESIGDDMTDSEAGNLILEHDTNDVAGIDTRSELRELNNHDTMPFQCK